MARYIIGIAALAVAAGSAQAAYFSFASDDDHTSWTFAGAGPLVKDAADPTDPIVLLVDDDNGPLLPLKFAAEFDATFEIKHVGSLPIGGGNFSHNYLVNGSFLFTDASGAPLLVAKVNSALMTAVGKAFTWGTSTATIQGSDIPEFTTVDYTWLGQTNAQYGLYQGTKSIDPEDFAFTLTVLNSDGKPGVPLSDADHLPTQKWFSEGSYSGSSHFETPAPGAMGLLGLAGLVGLRRRR